MLLIYLLNFKARKIVIAMEYFQKGISNSCSNWLTFFIRNCRLNTMYFHFCSFPLESWYWLIYNILDVNPIENFQLIFQSLIVGDYCIFCCLFLHLKLFESKIALQSTVICLAYFLIHISSKKITQLIVFLPSD